MNQTRREFIRTAPLVVAAASIANSSFPQTLPERWSTGIKAACFTPQSYFDRVLDLDSQVELLCFGLILVETLGAHPAPKKAAEISDDAFGNCANASRPWVSHALQKLEASRMIIRTRDRHEWDNPDDPAPKAGGRCTYALAEEYVREVKSAGKEKLKGRCPHCKTVALFETRFVPVPHNAFRKLGACVDPATYKVTMAILSLTVEWNREGKCIDVAPAEIEKARLLQMTGLEDRQVTEGISQAVKLGLIGQIIVAGKPSIYWANPEKMGSLERRKPRTVKQPKQTKKKTNSDPPEKPKPNPVEPTPTHAVESKGGFFGRCLNCDHFVNFEAVSEQEYADAQPKPSPRHGPPRKPAAQEEQIFSSYPLLSEHKWK